MEIESNPHLCADEERTLCLKEMCSERINAATQSTFPEDKEKFDHTLWLGSNKERISHNAATKCRFSLTRLYQRIPHIYVDTDPVQSDEKS